MWFVVRHFEFLTVVIFSAHAQRFLRPVFQGSFQGRSFPDRWSRGTKTLGTRVTQASRRHLHCACVLHGYFACVVLSLSPLPPPPPPAQTPRLTVFCLWVEVQQGLHYTVCTFMTARQRKASFRSVVSKFTSLSGTQLTASCIYRGRLSFPRAQNWEK